MSRKTQRIIRWGLVAGWAAVIFAFSSLPGSSVPGDYGNLGHFIEYSLLGALLYLALRLDRSPGAALVLAVTLSSLYGITDELHQSFVPMRVPDVRDWAVDTLGALIGSGVLALIERAWTRKSR